MGYPPAAWAKCSGEAHSNPYIDHCMVCLPFWGEYPISPECECVLTRAKSGRSGWCEACEARFSLVR